MPVTIYVRSADESAPAEGCPSLTFDGPRVAIGRGPSCEVRLPDPSVSHRHATLQITAGAVTVADEGSRNGTFVGSRKLASRAPYTLRSGELLRVGRVWLEVRLDQRPATPELSMATKDLALALVSRAMRALGDDASPRVIVEDGPDAGTEVVLSEDGRPYVVGRGNTCELPLADEDTSREHVAIVRRGNAVFVRDLASKNGSFLEGNALPESRDVPWRTGQRVTVGSTILVLEEPATLTLRSIEDAEDEPLAEADVPPPPSRAKAEPSAPSSSASSPPASSSATAAEPAPADADAPAPIRERRRTAPADIALVGAAIVIFVLSLAGLVWLLRT